MRLPLLGLLLAGAVLSGPLEAEPIFCDVPGNVALTALDHGGPLVSVAPTPPTSTRPLTFSAGTVSFEPSSASAVEHDGTIDITLSGRWLMWTTPPQPTCSLASLGPLAAGTYTVDLYVVDVERPDTGAVRVATGSLVVQGGAPPAPAPTPTPTLVPTLQAVLAALMLAAAWFALTRARRAA